MPSILTALSFRCLVTGPSLDSSDSGGDQTCSVLIFQKPPKLSCSSSLFLICIHHLSALLCDDSPHCSSEYLPVCLSLSLPPLRSVMSAKAISEQTGKEFLYKYISTSATVQNRFRYVNVTAETDFDRLPQQHPWLLTEVREEEKQENHCLFS